MLIQRRKTVGASFEAFKLFFNALPLSALMFLLRDMAVSVIEIQLSEMNTHVIKYLSVNSVI